MDSKTRKLSKITKNREKEASRIRTRNPIAKLTKKADKENAALLEHAKRKNLKSDQAEIAEIRKRNIKVRNTIARKAQEMEER